MKWMQTMGFMLSTSLHGCDPVVLTILPAAGQENVFSHSPFFCSEDENWSFILHKMGLTLEVGLHTAGQRKAWASRGTVDMRGICRRGHMALLRGVGYPWKDSPKDPTLLC